MIKILFKIKSFKIIIIINKPVNKERHQLKSFKKKREIWLKGLKNKRKKLLMKKVHSAVTAIVFIRILKEVKKIYLNKEKK